ncbi:MAG: hypothetical protein C0444_00675 [Microbacterium sp.]|nr:hypothetical protein [Microbacterium sp.]MBA4346901.1 hypothetical protein [Microbacterium sp.]
MTTTQAPTAARVRARARSGWPAVTGLLLLSALPILGGALRLGELGADPASAPSPVLAVVIVAHIVGMSVYCLLGAFQFSPALRCRAWHRRVGRVLIPAGIIAALASITLGVFFSGPDEKFALAMVRIAFAVPMLVFLVLATTAIVRRDFTAHGAWMTRAYAIAVTGGTQALVLIVWSILGGETSVESETWLVGVGFVINSLVAEVIIRRRARRGLRRG